MERKDKRKPFDPVNIALEWRKELRRIGYIKDPYDADTQFQSVTGVLLDRRLLEITKIAWANQSRYYSLVAAGESHSQIRFPPMPIRQSDSEGVEHLKAHTKEQLCDVITSLINLLEEKGDEDAHFFKEIYYKQVRKQNKDELIDFCQALKGRL